MSGLLSHDWWRGLYAQHRGKLFAAQAVVFAAIGFVLAGYFWGMGTSTTPPAGEALTKVATAETLWTCSMHPQIRQRKPGKCPLCGMDLIPVTKSAGGMRTLAISPDSKALMQIETLPVDRTYVTHQIPMVGRVDFDETKLSYITAWVPGRLDRLYVDYTGVQVKKGDHMVYIYSEQLYSAQVELIQALRNRRGPSPATTALVQPIDLVESAREKLRLLGLTDQQIADIAKQNEPSDHLTIFAPLGGVVIEKLKQQGERVQLGERIYTIADLSQVWVHLDAYESDLPWVRYGQDVTITTEAYPGEEFHGRIAFIQPVLDDKTRTVKVRVNVPNETGKLKPDMFVHAVVRPQVAAGGKVMDVSLAGKWISPMHPEIVKDAPGVCDICGMPLVRAESLGYVTPGAAQPPLVIPYRAALVTGTRAIVYVQLPNMPTAAEPALQTLSVVVQEGDAQKTREAFATYASMLEHPYNQPGTDFARQLWNEYADRLAKLALAGQRATSAAAAEQALNAIIAIMSEAREQFAPPNRPTFEGREIVLGPRAGDYYLVRNGLHEGELVVTQGNFKIDSEIQIEAKPSMMTPEGGGGGGHEHGGHGAAVAQKAGAEQGSLMTPLPAEFHQQLLRLDTAYGQVTAAIQRHDADQAAAAFARFGQTLNQVDSSQLTGHPRMRWKELAMLLGNDAVEGSDVKQIPEADRIYVLLQGHMRRMREQLGIHPGMETPTESIAVSPGFQSDLAAIWERYLAVAEALAKDSFRDAHDEIGGLQTAVATLNDKSLSGRAQQVWRRERSNLDKLIDRLDQASDIQSLRAEFFPLSQEIGVLAATFGFGSSKPVFRMHCPMAFEQRGAVWYQNSEEVRNPYFGSAMIRCADQIERVSHQEPTSQAESTPQTSHSSH